LNKEELRIKNLQRLANLDRTLCSEMDVRCVPLCLVICVCIWRADTSRDHCDNGSKYVFYESL